MDDYIELPRVGLKGQFSTQTIGSGCYSSPLTTQTLCKSNQFQLRPVLHSCSSTLHPADWQSSGVRVYNSIFDEAPGGVKTVDNRVILHAGGMLPRVSSRQFDFPENPSVSMLNPDRCTRWQKTRALRSQRIRSPVIRYSNFYLFIFCIHWENNFATFRSAVSLLFHDKRS